MSRKLFATSQACFGFVCFKVQTVLIHFVLENKLNRKGVSSKAGGSSAPVGGFSQAGQEERQRNFQWFLLETDLQLSGGAWSEEQIKKENPSCNLKAINLSINLEAK